MEFIGSLFIAEFVVFFSFYWIFQKFAVDPYIAIPALGVPTFLFFLKTY